MKQVFSSFSYYFLFNFLTLFSIFSKLVFILAIWETAKCVSETKPYINIYWFLLIYHVSNVFKHEISCLILCFPSLIKLCLPSCCPSLRQFLEISSVKILTASKVVREAGFEFSFVFTLQIIILIKVSRRENVKKLLLLWEI